MYSPSLTSPNCVLIIPCPSSLGVTAFLRENVRGAIKTATCVGSGRRCIGEMLAAQWMVVAWQPQSGSERCCASTPWMDAFDPIKASVVFGDHTGVARLMKSQTSGLDPLSERIQIRQRAQRDAPGARSPLTFTSSRSVVAPCYPRTVFTPTFSSRSRRHAFLQHCPPSRRPRWPGRRRPHRREARLVHAPKRPGRASSQPQVPEPQRERAVQLWRERLHQRRLRAVCQRQMGHVPVQRRAEVLCASLGPLSRHQVCPHPSIQSPNLSMTESTFAALSVTPRPMLRPVLRAQAQVDCLVVMWKSRFRIARYEPPVKSAKSM